MSSTVGDCSLRHRTLILTLFLLYLSGSSSASCPISCINCPCFTSSPYTFDVAEDTPIGTTISTLSATSPSGLSLMYTSESSDFNIDEMSGALTVATELDYETTNLYQFRVAATDGSSNVGRGHVTITVLNRNDHHPQCSNSVVYFSVREGQTNVNLPLPNCTDGDSPGNPTFTYSITNSGLFSVDPTGLITLLQPLDYETEEIHDLTVTVSDSGIPPGPLSTTLRVVIVVEPVNEHTPVFTQTQFEFNVSENVAIGRSVGQVTATDQDNGRDGVVTYTINTGQTNLFTVDPSTGHIILTRSLDYEARTSHSFSVRASDNSEMLSSRRTSSVNVVINIVDINDNSPTFSQPVYYQDVPENSNPGSHVLQLSCVDLDSGDNQELVYSITSGNDERKFTIDSTNGEVTLDSILDYDNPAVTDFFTLTAECQEVAYPYRTSATVMLIEVTSYNQYDPLPMNTEYSVSISENAVPGTAILRVTASDRDRGLAGVLRYYFNFGTVQLPSCPEDLVSIDESSGVVYLLSHLDYENGPRNIYCIATIWDSEIPPRPNEVDVYITVTNANDVGPRCYPSINTIYIPEDQSIGDVVFTLPCNDSDSSNLQYTISSISSLPFRLDSNGALILQSSLDYERESSYVIPIQISDGSFVTNSSVYALITSINEHPPLLTQQEYQCTINENSPIGTSVVCNVHATDPDEGIDGEVGYRISPATDAFLISDSTGDLLLTRDIDCEMQTEYSFTVEAYDRGSPSFSVTANVTVTVLDINDNSPSLTPFLFESLMENAPIGTGVTTVTCMDIDQGSNAELSLRILDVFEISDEEATNVTSAGLFSINPMDGVVTVSGSINFEIAQRYKLTIQCSDHGSPSLSTQSMLFIEVTPVNEYAPVFTDLPTSLRVSEGANIGHVIATFAATDQDKGEDGKVSFFLISSDPLPFDINEQSGIITLSNVLNCELSQQYTFSVVVEDRGQVQRLSQVSAVINITECHLGTVVPNQIVYTANVAENSPAGTSVTTVSCSSTRVNVLTEIEPLYRIAQDDSGLFEIEPNNGDITLRGSPDFEWQQSHLLTVQCYDPNYPNIANNFSVYVAVLPENEHTPEFSSDHFIVSVSESARLGSLILQLVATDEDSGEDGMITYQLRNQTNSNFLINHKTGEVLLTAALDRETIDELIFTVIAQDLAVNETLRRSSSTTVTVQVSDTNDNWPQCSRTVHHLVVSPQTLAPSVLIETFGCGDSDIGVNADLVYEFGDESVPTSMFEIDRESGSVLLIDSLDASDSVYYYLPVIVKDSGAPSLSTTLLVIIDVQEPSLSVDIDVNSNQYLSLVEAEGLKNSVMIILEDFSTSLWKGTNAEDNFDKEVAHSVTNYCALFPEACSLVSGCSGFYGTREKRAIEDTYATFTEPSIVILSNYTNDVSSTSSDTVSLRVQFYVALPPGANRSPYRETNYVIPRATLNLIVEQDGGTIEAVVRDSVAPPLTQAVAADGWMIATLVILGVVVPPVLLVVIVLAAYKYKQRSKNKVVSLVSNSGRKPSTKKQVSTDTTTTNSTNRASKNSNTSNWSGLSTKATCSSQGKRQSLSMFFSRRRESDEGTTKLTPQGRASTTKRGSNGSNISSLSGLSNKAVCGKRNTCSKEIGSFTTRHSRDTTPSDRLETPSDISEISLQDSEGASLENHASRSRQGTSPREMLNSLRQEKGLKTPEHNVPEDNFPYTPRRPALRLNIPMWSYR